MNSATTIKATANGTVNRATLRKLVQAGKCEARIDYRYDDHDSVTRGEWLPARFSETGEVTKTGFINFDEFDFDSSSGRAYKRDDGRVLLRVHSNLVFEIRLAK